jgi:hypothetical protein
MVLKTDFSDDAEYFGGKIFARRIFRGEETLICELFIDSENQRFLTGGS